LGSSGFGVVVVVVVVDPALGLAAGGFGLLWCEHSWYGKVWLKMAAGEAGESADSGVPLEREIGVRGSTGA
jgi:hypothetical protein